jgi:hypothetical protein
VPGPACDFELIEQHVSDLDGAIRLFAAGLEGTVVTRQDSAEESVAELSWQAGTRLRLVRASSTPDGPRTRPSGGLAFLRFRRPGSPFDAADRRRVADLSRRLGVSLQLRD